MKITALTLQVKHPDRVNVFIDGKYELSLYKVQLLDLRIAVGVDITPERLVDLHKASDLGKAYGRALQYALTRPRSVREMRLYCKRKQWSDDICNIVIEKLIAKGYLDDAVFAKAWVEQRSASQKASQRKLTAELQQKGVAQAIIQQVIAETGHSEQTALQQLIAKKRKLTRYAADDKKLLAYLMRQGFSYDAVRQALNQ